MGKLQAIYVNKSPKKLIDGTGTIMFCTNISAVALQPFLTNSLHSITVMPN